jgi:hypothetical protein
MESFGVERIFSSNLKSPSIAAAILLFLGIPIWYFVSVRYYDFYYYMLLRLVVCFISAYCSYLLKNQNHKLFWIMILVAFLFNPIVILAFLKIALIPIDLIIAFIFLWAAKESRREKADSPQETNPQLKRILISGCVSLAIGVSIVRSFRFSFGNDLMIHDRINEFLGTPALMIFDRLASEGDFVLRWWGSLMGSMLFYGFIAWLLLLLWSRIRTSRD